MLVLSGRVDEKFIIENGRIVVTILRIDGDKIKLGFEAPRGIAINREVVQIAVDQDRRNDRRR